MGRWWGGWLAVLIGMFTLAHLWAHATSPYDQPRPWGISILSPCSHQTAYQHHDDHDDDHDGHHDEHVHSKQFILPAAWCAPVAHQPMTLVAVADPQTLPRVFPTRPTGRSPPRDHRGRAALTHTLEVYRS
ncbi:MAG: hypothetical protein JWQ95_3866 [Sphaerisporangium sp.]|jgi:hypothetical protein|nr:hypothetical protein [Sphaerisporangium sp.]